MRAENLTFKVKFSFYFYFISGENLIFLSNFVAAGARVAAMLVLYGFRKVFTAAMEF